MLNSVFSGHLALAALALTPTALGNPIYVPHHGDDKPTQASASRSASEIFSHLLSLADSSLLHEALHNWHPKFADGAFASDKSAAEAIHKESPALATAILELAKRQDASPPNNTDSASPTSEQPPVTSVETLSVAGSTAIVVQTSIESLSPSIIPVQPTSASPAPQTTSRAPVVTSVVPTSSPVAATQTTVVTSSAAASPSSPVSTDNASPSSSPATHADASQSTIFMTTFTPPGGQPTVITSLMVVELTGSAQNDVTTTLPATHQSGTLRDAGHAVLPAAAFSGFAGTVALFLSGLVF